VFDRLSIPTPFQVGPVNAYLAADTIVDPGPASEDAWDTLQAELDAHDTNPGDIEQVLVTHPHPDHFGLAKRFRDHGARVLASGPAAAIIGAFDDRLRYEQEYFKPFFKRHGLPDSTTETITELPEAFVQYAPNVDTDRVLDAGDTVEVGDATLTVDTVQGHAPGELTFEYTTDRGETHAIVGDNVLAEITPNPLLQPPPEPGGDRPRVLPAFNDSLRELRAREYDRLLPGHRSEITDPHERITAILDAHEDRTATVAELVDGPTTAVEVMHGLFDDLPATEAFSGMSEAIGHLDVLEARGDVRRRDTDDRVVYEPV
jgi:glyoxylase-like metal-dependent hydrolase (beta-lactamase superfamily II)